VLQKNRGTPKLGVADVAKQLHAVNQGAWTFQTMIFETVPLRLHLAIGALPSSSEPPRLLELAPLLTRQEEPARQ
jgi:hypothetical protein